jgi:hypothetical protein
MFLVTGARDTDVTNCVINHVLQNIQFQFLPIVGLDFDTCPYHILKLHI